MGFEILATLECDGDPIQIGGRDKHSGKENPKSVEGYYMGFKMTEGKFGPSKLHVFKTKNGNTGVWGKTNLDSQLLQVKPGTMTRATFTGTVPSNKGNDMLKFKVEVDKSNTIDVEGVATSTSDDFNASDASEPEETDLNDDSSTDDTLVSEPVRRPAQPARPNLSKAQAFLGGGRKVG